MIACRAAALLLVCALPSMLAKTIGHQDCHMDTMGVKDVGAVLQRLAIPFIQIRNERNQQLDQIFASLLRSVAPNRMDMMTLKNIIDSLNEGLPDYGNILKKVVEAALIGNVTLPVMENFLKNCQPSGAPARLDMEAENMAFPNDLLERLVTEISLFERIEAGVSCDEQCLTRAIAPFAGKHVKIEDVARAFVAIVSEETDMHRDRYFGFRDKAEAASKTLAFDQSSLKKVLGEAERYLLKAQQLRQGIQTITGTHDLLAGLTQLGC